MKNLKSFFERGPDEDEQIYVIETHLLSERQEIWLRNNDLSVADLLNGRFNISFEAEIVETFFRAWNTEIGASIFMDKAFGDAMLKSIREVFGDIPIVFDEEGDEL